MTETISQKIEGARAYLAATVALTPDSPAGDLLAAAAEYRVHLLALIEVADAMPAPRVPAGFPPLETERQALDLPAVRAIYEAMHASNRRGVGDEAALQLLEDACAAAGVELGAYDRRILVWLAGWEAQMCAVIAGLVTRAAAAGENRLPPAYESTIGQAFRDAVRWCEAQDSEDLAEQGRFYRSAASALGIVVDPR